MQSFPILPIESSMGASTLQSQASRQSLHLHRDSASRAPRHRISPIPSSPSLSSTRASVATSATASVGSFNSSICSVLCMYDFHSDDPDHLPFVKNEILEIVKQGDNGWWAAFRIGGRVGWIPQAFVNTLSAKVAEKLRNTREELRIYEYDAEQLYISAPTQRNQHLYDSGGGTPPPTTWKPLDAYCAKQSTDPDTSPPLIFQGLQRPREEPPLSHVARMPRSAPSKSTPSFPANQEIPKRKTRDRAGSLPTRSRSFRQRPIPVDERPLSTRLSSTRDSSDVTRVSTNAKPVIDGLPDGLVKRSRSQKLKQAMGFADAHSQPAVQSQPAVPWALLPAYSDQVDTDSNGNVRWATLDALVDKLTTNVLTRDPIKAADGRKYRNIFLMTFRTFTTADTLFDMLVQRYRMVNPEDLTIREFQEWRNHAIGMQRSVLTIFAMWLEDHRLLDEEPHIAQRMTKFLHLIVMPPLSTQAKLLIQTVERLTFATPADASPKNSPRRRQKLHPHKNDLLKLSAADVAEQLSLLEFKLYAKVTPQECIRHANAPSTRNDSNLFVFCSTHDKLAAWVKTSILNNNALGKRADTIDFWIKVAEKCKQLNNFSSMSAMINALSSTVISQLHLTWAHAGRKSTLDALLRHNEPTGGFSGYRNLMQNVDGSCVPFVGMYMTDLVHIQDQFSDEKGRICFFQKQRWYETVSAMLRYQSKPYDIAENNSTLKFVEKHLREVSTKDQNWYWSRSQEVQESEQAHADIRKGLEAAGF